MDKGTVKVKVELEGVEQAMEMIRVLKEEIKAVNSLADELTAQCARIRVQVNDQGIPVDELLSYPVYADRSTDEQTADSAVAMQNRQGLGEIRLDGRILTRVASQV